ncbi:plasmid mobilization relaxosome protein MobC [Peptoniphilus equinus]|uniref:Plasmid mobilization relaxosome protein MobC n=1 Tax=Peptoniphilus equinus TaxID=3016343 RepID=A0ABY7QR92_9FIRM|nr:plasmid mobilization relaxosome protein MobC [Peptoniphilus equinus]WBW49309.1 plasmid mobilization relaxosome protein MobC [Peptoniphilus equinus]
MSSNSHRERNKVLFLRMTENERKLFEGVFAKSPFVNRTNLVLYLLSHAKIVNIHYDMSVFRNLQIHLSQMGNNLNQIARRANQSEGIYDDDVQSVLAMRQNIVELSDALDAIRSQFEDNSIKEV